MADVPFGYWVEQKHADPVLLRKPAYIPEPSDLRTVTPLYASLSQSVVSLVIAAREAFDTGMLPDEEQAALDKALESFASAVPYENEPTRAAPPAMDREAVARIIDPTSFCDVPYTDDPIMIDMVKTWQDTALAKADAILSTLSANAIRQGEGATTEQFAVVGSDLWRHVKRGTVYKVIGTAELQAGQPQLEHAELVIYRGEDGKLWARNSGEFHDGRFVPATPASHASDGGKA